jgi:hypothetical protein
MIFCFKSSHEHLWQNLLHVHAFVMRLWWWTYRSRNMWKEHKWQLIIYYWLPNCRSQWPRRLRSRSAAARLLRFWVRIPLGSWISISCECCVLSGRGFCDELITRPDESYWPWFVVVCDLETSWMRKPWSTRGCSAKKQTKRLRNYLHSVLYNQFIARNTDDVKSKRFCSLVKDVLDGVPVPFVNIKVLRMFVCNCH